VIVGAVVARGDHHFNSALLLDPAGVTTGRYDKQHLVPFAERPIGDRPFVTRFFPNTGRFRPEPEAGPIRFGSFGIATSIYYEDVLPAVIRLGVNAGATDLLVNVSNDAWFGDTPENHMHFALARFPHAGMTPDEGIAGRRLCSWARELP
jgi:apolipoprotein N-acyltransferase